MNGSGSAIGPICLSRCDCRIVFNPDAVSEQHRWTVTIHGRAGRRFIGAAKNLDGAFQNAWAESALLVKEGK